MNNRTAFVLGSLSVLAIGIGVASYLFIEITNALEDLLP